MKLTFYVVAVDFFPILRGGFDVDVDVDVSVSVCVCAELELDFWD